MFFNKSVSKKAERVSIRKQLFTLFVPCLFSLWIASGMLSYFLVSTFSREAFDRELINSADSIAARVRIKDGKAVADLPPAALAILKHDDSDRCWYRIQAPDGKVISGDQDLPAPKLLLGTKPVISTGTVAGQPVMLAEMLVTVDGDEGGNGQKVIVQVAETMKARNDFQHKMLLSLGVPQLLVIAVGLFAVFYGVEKILRPLRSIQQQVMFRSQSDLRALSDEETPEEVYPLVKALNHLFGRLRDDIEAHRRFIANAAHQLRTPLAGLKTYSSVGTDMTGADELKQVVRELDQGIDRASRLVSQLLLLARTDGGAGGLIERKATLDLNFLVSDVVAEFVNQAVLKQVELTYESSPGSALIIGESHTLRHLISNLIENAVLYTPPGGRVDVRVYKDEQVTLSVCDNGSGIPEEDRTRVFERFYRVAGTKGNGSGLGLAIVKEVAGLHEADVTIDSGPRGTGSSVLVRFPAVGKPEAVGARV